MAFASSQPAGRGWLPASALDPGRVQPLIEAAIQAWSRKWFARRPIRLADELRRHDGAQASSTTAWRRVDEDLWIGLEGPAQLAAEMLDHPLSGHLLSAADKAVVERLAEACVADFQLSLCTLLRLAPAEGESGGGDVGAPPAQDGWTCTLGAEQGRPLLRLVIGHELFVILVKSAVKTPPPPIRLRPVAEGTAAQAVGVSACLGHCELPLGEASTLGIGDVVVLDRAVDESLDLAIDGILHPGLCALVQEDERLALKLTTSLSG